MEECYKYFQCSNIDCNVRKQSEKKCWEIVDDSKGCLHHLGMGKLNDFSDISENKDVCNLCLYYRGRNYNLDTYFSFFNDNHKLINFSVK